MRQGKPSDVTLIETSIGDPVAQKLVEWALLRHPDSEVRFERYVAFIRANPDWPSMPLLHQRAEAKLWQDRRDAATVRRFFGEEQPTSPLGRLAFARMLKAEGDHAGAEREVRAAWRSAELSAELEAAVLDAFRDELTRADHVARMDWRIGAKDFGAAMRAAKRSATIKSRLSKLAPPPRRTPPRLRRCSTRFPAKHAAIWASRCAGFTGCVQHNEFGPHRGHVGPRQAGACGVARICNVKIPMNGGASVGAGPQAHRPWRARRPPIRWCARPRLRPIPITAPNSTSWPAGSRCGFSPIRPSRLTHFAHVDDGAADPIVRARAAYWRGRAAEAAGELEEMHAQYEAAARYPTAYYGQLARARLGLGEIALPARRRNQGTTWRANYYMLLTFSTRSASAILSRRSFPTSPKRAATPPRSRRSATHRALQRCPGMLLVGKTALARGLAMDHYAFPDIGVPNYSPIVPRSIAASSIRSCAPKAASTSATGRRPRRSG